MNFDHRISLRALVPVIGQDRSVSLRWGLSQAASPASLVLLDLAIQQEQEEDNAAFQKHLFKDLIISQICSCGFGELKALPWDLVVSSFSHTGIWYFIPP